MSMTNFSPLRIYLFKAIAWKYFCTKEFSGVLLSDWVRKIPALPLYPQHTHTNPDHLAGTGRCV